MYRLTENDDVILCLETSAHIPQGHPLWDDYQEWLDAGNTPEPAEAGLTEAEARAALHDAITAKRWAVETGGITVGGIPVATALDDQNRITSVLTAIALGGLEAVDFKTQAGWVRLTAEQIQGLGAAISAHIQACFSAERRHHEAVDKILTPAALALYDVDQDWPEGVY